ncbi:hypothetical protein HHI36_002940 [Cryptolaemus montrouzieri]|uniref:Uncharacterized protein n=1 Tax=Cryptolaemus montrouzieri TaxID=559131 RepID=A0ABD2PBX5_9CUCU
MQNANESFKHIMWKVLPKRDFVQMHLLRLGAQLAVLPYNKGNFSHAEMLQSLEIDSGELCLDSLQKIDRVQVRHAAHNIMREARMKRFKTRRKLGEDFKVDEGGPAPGRFRSGG